MKKIAAVAAVVLTSLTTGTVSADGTNPPAPPVPVPGADGLPPPLPGQNPTQSPVQSVWSPSGEQQYAAQQRAVQLAVSQIYSLPLGEGWSFKDWLTACPWPEIPTPNENNPYNRMFFICYGLLVRDGNEHLVTVQVAIYEDGSAAAGNMIIWDHDNQHVAQAVVNYYDGNNQIIVG